MSGLLESKDDGSLALFINGDLQFDSSDEFIYHEGLVLPALAIAQSCIASDLQVLVVGGGDGLVAREVFKSSRIASLDLVDYDPEILAFANKDLLALNESSLLNSRVTVHIKDAWDLVLPADSQNLPQSGPDNNIVTHEASGSHLLLSLKDCASDILDDESKLRALTRLAAEATGATVLEVYSHRFDPQGVTSLAMLAESHASLHSYPEANVVFWDCFTCGTTCNPELSVAVLVEALKPGTISKQLVSRS